MHPRLTTVLAIASMLVLCPIFGGSHVTEAGVDGIRWLSSAELNLIVKKKNFSNAHGFSEQKEVRFRDHVEAWLLHAGGGHLR